MPRPNRERDIQAERILAERIRVECNARGWTYARMAQAMTDVGCPIHPSALYKIEKGDPPRQITVNELAAMSLIWAIPMERLVSD